VATTTTSQRNATKEHCFSAAASRAEVAAAPVPRQADASASLLAFLLLARRLGVVDVVFEVDGDAATGTLALVVDRLLFRLVRLTATTVLYTHRTPSHPTLQRLNPDLGHTSAQGKLCQPDKAD